MGDIAADTVTQHKNNAAQASSPMSMDIEASNLPLDDDGREQRTGNVYTGTAHIITAVIGSGVLALSWSVGQLGWIAGPIILLLFAWCTYYTSTLLADCYRSPDPVTGNRNYIYMQAVKVNLSSRAHFLCGLAQYSNLIGTSIGYTIAAAINARAIQKTNCYHKLGVGADAAGVCLSSTTVYIVVYGAIQAVLSQIPNFGELWWLSYLAALMSFTYSSIALGLGIAKTAEAHAGHDYGRIGGQPIGHNLDGGQETEAQKIWNMFIALGNIAFAYSFSMILIEIEDTIKQKPSENKQMKRAVLYGISMTTFFYLSIGVFGYSAFGNGVGGNLLTSFESPYWLVDFANTCVVIHLIGAYQVFTQPVYQFVEASVAKKYPNSTFLSKGYNICIPGSTTVHLNLFRSSWRIVYVIITTIIAMVLPFFNDILGIFGALGFWPLTVYFPLAMYMSQFGIQTWSKRWIRMQLLSLITFLISLAALIGSIASIYLDVKDGIQLFEKD